MQIAILEDLFLILKLEYLNTSRSAFLFRTSLTLPPNALNSKWSLWPQTSETADTNVCLKMSKTCKWRIGNYLVPVTVSQRNQFYRVICKTFASTNSHLFVSLGYFGLQLRWSLKLHFFYNSDESLNCELPASQHKQIKSLALAKHDNEACPRFMAVFCGSDKCLRDACGHAVLKQSIQSSLSSATSSPWKLNHELKEAKFVWVEKCNMIRLLSSCNFPWFLSCATREAQRRCL
jgi:hypothetical protein